jgi:hypothetical protein
MKMMMNIMKTLVVSLLLIVSACGPVPGGALAGTAAQAPDNWAELVGDRVLCEIESRPANPHSIQLECFVFNDALYVQSHRWVNASWWPGESWALIWQKQPFVKVRIGTDIFELKAVVEQAHRNGILSGRGYDPVPEGMVVFRFDAIEPSEASRALPSA